MIHVPTRHAGLDPASIAQRALARVESWTPDQVRGDGGVDGMHDDYSAMTVNERLAAAGLSVEYDAAVAGGDLAATNEILAKVDLRRDAAGMHWSLGNGLN